MELQRILIIANKNFEADAILSAVLNNDFRHPSLDLDAFNIHHPVCIWTNREQGVPKPRLVLQSERFQFEIWCIQSIMTRNPNPADTYYYSRSIQKAIDFRKIMDFDKLKTIHSVFAFGTGGTPTEISRNGSLILGSGIFVSDASPELPADEKYNSSDFGKFISSLMPSSFFDAVNNALSSFEMKSYFEQRALWPPSNPVPFQVLADVSLVAVSDVNVKSYKDFKVKDQIALDAYNALKLKSTAYSVETTHGLIRLESDISNFAFITTVSDRIAYFDTEVTPRAPSQNFSCAFNGGIFISWFIPFLNLNTF